MMKLIKKIIKKSLKRPKLNPDNFQNLWLYSWDRNYLIEVTQKKTMKQNSQSFKYRGMQLKKKFNQ